MFYVHHLKIQKIFEARSTPLLPRASRSTNSHGWESQNTLAEGNRTAWQCSLLPSLSRSFPPSNIWFFAVFELRAFWLPHTAQCFRQPLVSSHDLYDPSRPIAMSMMSLVFLTDYSSEVSLFAFFVSEVAWKYWAKASRICGMEFEKLRGKATRLVQSIDDTAAVKGCHFLVVVQEFVMLEDQSISVQCPMSKVHIPL